MPAPDAPAWFADALATPFEEDEVVVDGCPVHHLRWGDPAKPGLVLIHGGAAHAQWWSFLAPFLAADWYVVAPDLSGHGDSGHRPEYVQERWSDEVMAVTEASGVEGPPVVVGHSLGGLVAATAAARYGERLAGAIMVDSGIRRPDPESRPSVSRRYHRPKKLYATREEALQRFRLIPKQPAELAYALAHIAATSVREVEGGWAWKFDPSVFGRRQDRPMAEWLPEARCRIALIRGELSRINPPEIAAFMYDLMHRRSPVVTIPEARHHVMVDQPLALVTALRALLADWDHSVPR